MKLLVKSLAGGNFYLDVEPTDTVAKVKQNIQESQGHAAELQKLIHSGKILNDDKTVADYEIKEKDFLVVMVSKPKVKPAAKEAPKPEASAGEGAAAGQASGAKSGDAATSTAPATPAPARTATEVPAAPTKSSAPVEAPSTPAPANSSFLTGNELEVAVNNIMEIGYSREEVQRAMRMSFNNPDRAVEYLMNGLPEQGPSESQAAAPAPAAAPAAAASGNLFEQAAAQAAAENQGGGDADMLPSEDDGHGRQVIDLGNPQVLAQLRTLVEHNPSALQPLIQALVQSNPQLAEVLSSDPEGFMRLLSGNADMGDEESFELPTMQQLPEQDRTSVEQIVAMGIPESKAIEAYLMCGKNVEMAVQYYFDNPGDFDD